MRARRARGFSFLPGHENPRAHRKLGVEGRREGGRKKREDYLSLSRGERAIVRRYVVNFISRRITATYTEAENREQKGKREGRRLIIYLLICRWSFGGPARARARALFLAGRRQRNRRGDLPRSREVAASATDWFATGNGAVEIRESGLPGKRRFQINREGDKRARVIGAIRFGKN